MSNRLYMECSIAKLNSTTYASVTGYFGCTEYYRTTNITNYTCASVIEYFRLLNITEQQILQMFCGMVLCCLR